MEVQAEQFDFRALGQTIKKARNDRGWTREQLAAMLGLTARYLVDIENEGQHPSLQVLYSLVTLFNISIDQFVFPNKDVKQNTLRRQLGLSLVKPGKEIEYTGKDGERRTRPAKEQGRSYAEYAADKAGGSFKRKLKIAIDTIIPQSKDFADFLRRMEAAGYEVKKRGETISFRAPGQENYTRLRESTLGEGYTAESIAECIQGKKRIVSAPKRDDKKIRLVILKVGLYIHKT